LGRYRPLVRAGGTPKYPGTLLDESRMPSRTYRLFQEAMAGRRQVLCTYGGFVRELCPVILGHTGGEERALTYQFGGQSSKELPPGGQWRCLSLSEVRDVQLRDGPWRAGASHDRPQGCV
jgi:hypothetical protein